MSEILSAAVDLAGRTAGFALMRGEELLLARTRPMRGRDSAGLAPWIAEELKGSGVSVCCVIGFPLGASLSSVKAFEAREAVAAGAQEIDMVINIGAVKSGDWELVKEDIAAVNAAKGTAKLKVIIETCLLTDEEKVRVCQIAKEVGADFVKTSTGFSTGGATVHDVELMRKTVGPEMGVKASGGVRTLADALAMIEAGASRLGASAGVKIIEAL